MKLIKEELKGGKQEYTFEVEKEVIETVVYTSDQLTERKAKLEARILSTSIQLTEDEIELAKINSLIALINV